jgi:NADH-quinone oxidoreductase subunit E
MSVRRLAAEQPEGFAFTPENLEWARAQIKKYPEGRQASAVLPILWRAQEQMGGWLPEPALRYVADMLGMAYIRVYEIATFYTMFNLAPVGRYYVQVCGTTPCWLRGADAIKDTCRRLIGEPNQVTPDGFFSWTEVECLGACVNAPMAQINKDYYEDLTPQRLEWILANLKAGREVAPGPQNGRQASAPLGGPTTLTDPDLYRDELPDDAPPNYQLETPSGRTKTRRTKSTPKET